MHQFISVIVSAVFTITKLAIKMHFETQCVQNTFEQLQYIFDTLLQSKLFEINIKIAIFVGKNGHPK